MTIDLVLTCFVYVSLYNCFVCGSFGAYTAEQKNRNPMEGFLYALFLGPIGVAAVACLPTLPAKETVPGAYTAVPSPPVASRAIRPATKMQG